MMADYRDYLNSRGVARGPWVVRDSGRHAERENERSSIEAEGCQSCPKGIARKVGAA